MAFGGWRSTKIVEVLPVCTCRSGICFACAQYFLKIMSWMVSICFLKNLLIGMLPHHFHPLLPHTAAVERLSKATVSLLNYLLLRINILNIKIENHLWLCVVMDNVRIPKCISITLLYSICCFLFWYYMSEKIKKYWQGCEGEGEYGTKLDSCNFFVIYIYIYFFYVNRRIKMKLWNVVILWRTSMIGYKKSNDILSFWTVFSSCPTKPPPN